MYRKYVKRFLDILFSLIALLICSPIFIFIVILLLLTGNHQIFFFQKRIGKEGIPFNICKFTTMRKNSDNTGTKAITLRNDARILPVGRFLRRTKLNELPQLVNIFFGSMSIIGPRPIVPIGFENHNETAKQYISKLKPGLSGIGSVIFRDEEYYVSKATDPRMFYRKVILPHKGELETWYYHNCSFYVDCMIVFLTVWAIFFPSNKWVYKIFPTLPKIHLEIKNIY